MQVYPPEMYLTGGELLYDFDSDLINSCAQGLSEENVCVCYSWKDNKHDSKEKWFMTKYSSEEITQEQRNAWKNATGRFILVFCLSWPKKFLVQTKCPGFGNRVKV